MNIITCIKQVPASSNVKVDPITGVLIRDGQNVKMNPFDLFGIEMACSIKDQQENVNVHAITMGPPSATQVLNEALYMGADDATLISDRKFAGADVLATSYTISQLIKHIGNYDLIICGKQTTDGDTAQVGPEVAEFLNIPHVPYVHEILKVNQDSVTVRSSYETYEEIITVKLPCLITIDKDVNTPRLPSYRRRLHFNQYPIPMVTLKDLSDTNEKNYGLNGSPTQVDEIYAPDKTMESHLISGTSDDLAKKIIDVLKESRYL
jgi:electron transfer flavoprotein beta subunit